MEIQDALDCLSALAHANRLAVFRLLVQAGDEGMAVGELGEATGLPGATLTNHLHALRRAGLVRDQRLGRVIQCHADYARMNALLGYLTENCCGGAASADACDPASSLCKTPSGARR